MTITFIETPTSFNGGSRIMDTNQHPMTEQDRATYTKLIEWLKQSWYGVPDSDVLLP